MLVRYSFFTACAVGLLISVILVMQDNTLTAADIYSSIGLNLFASVVFALMFAALANWIQDRHTQETISESLEGVAERITQNMARTNRLFLPSKHYDAVNPTDRFGDGYNEDLTVELEESGFFAFYGPSARYVAARLLAAHHYPQQIRIAMINPGNRRAISRRASDRMSWPKSAGMTIGQVERELEDELLMNVVSLFDCRRLCSVELLYNYDTAVYRYVMLDESVYVSWYHSAQSAHMEMPETYRFGKDSFIYSTLRMDLMRKFEISSPKVVFDAADDDQVLIDHLRELTVREVTADDLARWRAEQLEDSANFRAYLTALRRKLVRNDRVRQGRT
ncbi:hypothetical protein FHX81_8086 [Saccharothrix saharensis]|uniref:Uncharacterized protein n=2 Tax=Saccharothrix saharensis TaxID=571190 RepID=A0A543JRW5_9PSEU|nr:hypothetical protein FHX81_8086 [Saccharothrix saharensis]